MFLSILLTIATMIWANNPLKQSWKKQVKPIQNGFLHADIQEVRNNLSHSMNPWEQASYQVKGRIWLNHLDFLKSDTLTAQSGKTYYSKYQFIDHTLSELAYRGQELSVVTKEMLQTTLVKSCKYSPTLMLDYFYRNNILPSKSSTESTLIYSTQVFKHQVNLYIDRMSSQVTKITTISDLESDDQYFGFGDVKDEYFYSDYVDIRGYLHPLSVDITKLNGKLKDRVTLSNPSISKSVDKILEDPKEYSIETDKAIEPDITVEQYSPNIWLINLHHCGTRSLMVEFSDFVLVAESPLNSKNGETLLAEVKKIAPTKPIKYFAFGHFHPHYTGGIRPFIHQGAQIVTVKQNEDYINFIANVPHAINPDSLYIDPKEIEFAFVNGEKQISDGDFEMKIYHIGKQSSHTSDYLIYYFPKEKMVFQDDLIRLNENTTKENMSKTTKGFYEAVKALDLDVNEVVQNWHVFDKSKRMVFDFETIEKIMTGE